MLGAKRTQEPLPIRSGGAGYAGSVTAVTSAATTVTIGIVATGAGTSVDPEMRLCDIGMRRQGSTGGLAKFRSGY